MEGNSNMNGGDGSVSFFKHVFNFDEDTKMTFMNEFTICAGIGTSM